MISCMRIGIEPGCTKTELIALGDEGLERRGAAVGNAACQAVMADYCARLALAGVINILDPDAIVPGGGLSNMDIVYEAVPAQWR